MISNKVRASSTAALPPPPPPVEFSSSEVFHLRLGTKKFGTENFDRILQTYSFAKGRTAEQLKAKWTAMTGSRTMPEDGKGLPYKASVTGRLLPEAASTSALRAQHARIGRVLAASPPPSSSSFAKYGHVSNVPEDGNDHERKRPFDDSPKGVHPLDISLIRKRQETAIARAIPRQILDILDDANDFNRVYDESNRSSNHEAQDTGAMAPSTVMTQDDGGEDRESTKASMIAITAEEHLEAPSQDKTANLNRVVASQLLRDVCTEIAETNRAAAASSDSEDSDSTSSDNDEMERAQEQSRQSWLMARSAFHVELLWKTNVFPLGEFWNLLQSSLAFPVLSLIHI